MDKPKPTKERVHEWLTGRAKERQPVPSMEEIRRQLGFDMTKNGKKPRK